MRTLLAVVVWLHMVGRIWSTTDVQPSVCFAMIARNERDNLEANLPRWRALGLVDAIVVGIDDRSTDATAFAVVEALPETPHWIFYYHFEGFGRARSRVLQEAWLKFPQMSHVFIADPDWEPDASTIKKSDLDFLHGAFTFTIFDRNSHTTRRSHWLVRHQPNITFAYRLHEQLILPFGHQSTRMKDLQWQVREVEVEGRKSWHSMLNHGHTQSYKRYLFDLELLRQDEADLGDDAHVLYYRASTSFAALEALTGRGQHEITPEMKALIDDGIDAYKRRLAPHHLANPMTHREQTWASARFLGYAYQFFRFDVQEATHWYNRCIEIDPARADCPVYLAKLQREHGSIVSSWAAIAPALKRSLPERSFANNFYVQDCLLPLEGGLTLLGQFAKGGQPKPNFTAATELPPKFVLGWRLLRTAQDSCTSEKFDLFVIETADTVAAAEATFRRLATLKPGGTAQLETGCFRGAPHEDEQRSLLEKWGLRRCE